MTAFVTGAAGFVGSHVVRALLSMGEEVRVLVRPTSDQRNLTGLDVDVRLGDVRELQALAEAAIGCRVVYHVGALYSSRPEDAAEMYAVNVEGTKNVARAALLAGANRLVLTSTIGTIGRPEDGTVPTEEIGFNLWSTASHYVKSKHLSEVAAQRLAGTTLDLVIVHPCAPVGPGDYKPTVTGQRIVDVLRGQPPSYLGGGINFVSVGDVAQGHVLAAREGRAGHRYILGHAQGNLTREDFLQLLEQVSGQPAPSLPTPVHRAARWRPRRRTQSAGKPQALTADPGRAIAELGLPQTPLSEAFSEAVDWFRANGYV